MVGCTSLDGPTYQNAIPVIVMMDGSAHVAILKQEHHDSKVDQ